MHAQAENTPGKAFGWDWTGLAKVCIAMSYNSQVIPWMRISYARISNVLFAWLGPPRSAQHGWSCPYRVQPRRRAGDAFSSGNPASVRASGDQILCSLLVPMQARMGRDRHHLVPRAVTRRLADVLCDA